MIAGTFFETSRMKTLLIAVYFAGWVALLVFCVSTFLLPQIRARGGMAAMFFAQKRKEKEEKSESFQPTKEIPMRSSRSDLPVRERIAAYVAERRREEGLPEPVPLRQNKGEEKSDVFPGKSFSPASVAAAAPYMTSSMNSTETTSEFDEVLDFALTSDIEMETESNEGADELHESDGYLNLDATNTEGGMSDDDLDFLDLDESFDSTPEEDTAISDEDFLEYASSIDTDEILISYDDFEDMSEIVDLEPDDIRRNKL